MINPNDYNLIICVNEQIDNNVAQKIDKSIDSIPDTLLIRVPPMGPQASILLLGISFVAVKICEGFFTKIGEMAAEKALGDLMGTIKEAQQEPYIMTAGGILKGDTGGYSLHHSIIYELDDGSTLKLLFKTDWNMGQFNKAIIIYNKEIRKYIKNENNQISKIIDINLPYSGFQLITVDLENETLIHVST